MTLTNRISRSTAVAGLLVAVTVPTAAVALATDTGVGSTPAGKVQQVGDPFGRTELYFGTDKPGPDVSEAQFRRFVADVVTPRFPDGLTILDGLGQFREEDGDIIREESKVLVLLYPIDFAGDANIKIEEIRGLYETQFEQQSVLRVDSEELVSF